jgi:hypothetical protein
MVQSIPQRVGERNAGCDARIRSHRSWPQISGLLVPGILILPFFEPEPEPVPSEAEPDPDR